MLLFFLVTEADRFPPRIGTPLPRGDAWERRCESMRPALFGRCAVVHSGGKTMKNHVWHKIAIVLVAVLTLAGTATAGWFGSDDKPKSDTQTPAATGQKEAMPQPGEVILSGTINNSSQLVDDHGKAFELADTDQGREVKSLIGKKVTITGTVMEEGGQQVISVQDYKLLKK
jgi:hypothetical protein